MGYKPPKKRYRLQFEDSHAGLEVSMGSLTTREFLDIAALADTVSAPGGSGVTAAVTRLFELTAKHLIAWNVDDEEGARVPATLDGLMSCDLDFVLAVVAAWQQAIAGVSAPLPSGSNGGGKFPAVSLPMEPLSPSRSS